MLTGILKNAGWTPLGTRTLKESDALGSNFSDPSKPMSVNAGAWWGMSFEVRSSPYPPFGHENDTPVVALLTALGGSGQIWNDPKIPDGVVRVVIGQKQ